MGIYQYTVNRVRQLCAERNMTPNALSYAAGISQSTIKSILNGESKNPGIVTLKKICDGNLLRYLFIKGMSLHVKCIV